MIYLVDKYNVPGNMRRNVSISRAELEDLILNDGEIKSNTDKYRNLPENLRKPNKKEFFKCFWTDYSEYDLVCLDIDVPMEDDDRDFLFDCFSENPYCWLVMITPSQKLRAYIKIEKQKDFVSTFEAITNNTYSFFRALFKFNFDIVWNIFWNKYKVKLDTHFKNRELMSFICWNEKIGGNEDCDVLDLTDFEIEIRNNKRDFRIKIEYDEIESDKLRKYVDKLYEKVRRYDNPGVDGLTDLNCGNLDLSGFSYFHIWTRQTLKLIEICGPEYTNRILKLWDYISRMYCYETERYNKEGNFAILRKSRPWDGIDIWKQIFYRNGLINRYVNKISEGNGLEINDDYISRLVYGRLNISEYRVDSYITENSDVLKDLITCSERQIAMIALPGSGKTTFFRKLAAKYNISATSPFWILRTQTVSEFKKDNINVRELTKNKSIRDKNEERLNFTGSVVSTYDAFIKVMEEINSGNEDIITYWKGIDFFVVDELHELIASTGYRNHAVMKVKQFIEWLSVNNDKVRFVYLTATPPFGMDKLGIEKVIKVNRKNNAFDKINANFIVCNKNRDDEIVFGKLLDDADNKISVIMYQSRDGLKNLSQKYRDFIRSGFTEDEILLIASNNEDERKEEEFIQTLQGDGRFNERIRIILTTSSFGSGPSFFYGKRVDYYFLFNAVGNIDVNLIEQTVNRFRDAREVNVTIVCKEYNSSAYEDIFMENDRKIDRQIEVYNKALKDYEGMEAHFDNIYRFKECVMMNKENCRYEKNDWAVLCKTQNDFLKFFSVENMKTYLKWLDDRWEFGDDVYISIRNEENEEINEIIRNRKTTLNRRMGADGMNIYKEFEGDLFKPLLKFTKKSNTWAVDGDFGLEYVVNLDKTLGGVISWIIYKQWNNNNRKLRALRGVVMKKIMVLCEIYTVYGEDGDVLTGNYDRLIECYRKTAESLAKEKEFKNNLRAVGGVLRRLFRMGVAKYSFNCLDAVERLQKAWELCYQGDFDFIYAWVIVCMEGQNNSRLAKLKREYKLWRERYFMANNRGNKTNKIVEKKNKLTLKFIEWVYKGFVGENKIGRRYINPDLKAVYMDWNGWKELSVLWGVREDVDLIEFLKMIGVIDKDLKHKDRIEYKGVRVWPVKTTLSEVSNLYTRSAFEEQELEDVWTGLVRTYFSDEMGSRKANREEFLVRSEMNYDVEISEVNKDESTEELIEDYYRRLEELEETDDEFAAF